MVLDFLMTLPDIFMTMVRSPEKHGEIGGEQAPGTGVDTAQSGDIPGAYYFDEFQLLTRRQTLYRNGTEIPLSSKLYQLLLLFLQRPDEILTRDDLTQAVWPGQVVTDAAIAKQMQRLRQLIDDTGREVPLLETHRGMGYRLTCAVSTDSPETPKGRRLRGSTWTRLALASLLLVGVSGWLVLDPAGSRSSSRDSDAPGLAIQPIAGDAAALTEGAVEFLGARLGPDTDIAPLTEMDSTAREATAIGSLQLSRSRAGPVAAIHLARTDGQFELVMTRRDGTGSRQNTVTGRSINDVLDRAASWLRGDSDTPSVAEPRRTDPYALASYFEGLAATGPLHNCERAMEYYRAAIARDPDFQRARLRLARCERLLGRPHEAAAIAAALLARNNTTDPALLLETQLEAAKAHLALGKPARARAYLESARLETSREGPPLTRLRLLSALTLMAQLDDDLVRAEALGLEHLALAEAHYPQPAYLAGLHLQLAAAYLASGQHGALRRHAEAARTLAEESGELDTLMESFRYLASSYFRDGELDAAVQLALAARPMIDKSTDASAKAFFLQYAAMALNLRGLFEPARAYTQALRKLGETSSNPMYGAIADLTVMHRLYVQGAYPEALALASSTRARLEVGVGGHAAIPLAMSFEAIAAARGGSLQEADAILSAMETRYPDNPALDAAGLRVRGHIAARRGRHAEAIRFLRKAESQYLERGVRSVANYIGYEIIELRLNTEPSPPWDDIQRLPETTDFDYFLVHLRARAHAAEGNYIGATTALEEARLRGNDLWSDEDQLLLERYQSALAMADARVDDAPAPGDIR